MACWMIFCMVVMRSYAGALTSQLSVRYMPAPIKNLEDLVNHPDMKVALETETAFSAYVKVQEKIHLSVNIEDVIKKFFFH